MSMSSSLLPAPDDVHTNFGANLASSPRFIAAPAPKGLPAPQADGCAVWLKRLRIALVLAFVQLCFSGYAIISQAVLSPAAHHADGSDGSAGGPGRKPLSPAVFIVCRDVGCSLVLLLAGRIQAGKFLWPHKQDRFLFVLIGICNVIMPPLHFLQMNVHPCWIYAPRASLAANTHTRAPSFGRSTSASISS